nr:FKBP-type peptidyl-prolyl cis-trans isomerase [Auraticoccus cholistanensis]
MAADGTAELDYVGVNARTGEVFDSSFERGQTAVFPLDQVVPGFSKGLEGQRVGSRVLIAMPGEDGYDASGGNPQAGIEVGDTLLFVVDVVATQLDGPEGTAVEPEEGLPEVSGPEDDPKITVPDGEAPGELVVQPLVEGEGKPVAAEDTITVNYRGVVWETGEVFDSSYEDGPQTGALSSLIPGWQQGLVDQPVGSRVLLVVPPDQGYPQGNQTPALEPGQTLVYVVDVLFTQAGQ